MANAQRLQELKEFFPSHGNKLSGPKSIVTEVNRVQGILEKILSTVEKPSGSLEEFIDQLDIVSNFFRKEKFGTVVLPVLQSIANAHVDLWKIATIKDTKMPLTPGSFENLKKSTAEIQDESGKILSPAQRERELQLFGVYGITMEKIGLTIRDLKK